MFSFGPVPRPSRTSYGPNSVNRICPLGDVITELERRTCCDNNDEEVFVGVMIEYGSSLSLSLSLFSLVDVDDDENWMDWRGVSIALCLRVCSPSLYRDTVPIFILMSLVAFLRGVLGRLHRNVRIVLGMSESQGEEEESKKFLFWLD